jgi:hypothetical protein
MPKQTKANRSSHIAVSLQDWEEQPKVDAEMRDAAKLYAEKIDIEDRCLKKATDDPGRRLPSDMVSGTFRSRRRSAG